MKHLKKFQELYTNNLELNEGQDFKDGSEYFTKVEGPFHTPDSGNLFIMKLEKTLSRYDGELAFGSKSKASPGEYIVMSETTQDDKDFTQIPGGKFYVLSESDKGKIVMFNKDSRFYTNATNNSKGYNTKEEAKKAISLIMNPEGKKGRQVQRGTYKDDKGKEVPFKKVSRYDSEGNLKQTKIVSKTDQGRTKEKIKTGL